MGVLDRLLIVIAPDWHVRLWYLCATRAGSHRGNRGRFTRTLAAMARLRYLRPRWWHGGAVLVLVATLAAVLVFAGGDDDHPRQGPPGTGPLTLVTLGDSTLSGEGTGVYEPGTNGQDGNWCHRSPKSAVHTTSVPGIQKTINLACSGAPSEHLRRDTSYRQYTEPSQTKRLAELTRNHRIAAVVIAVGANDEPHFSQHVTRCAKAWFGGTPCREAIAPGWRADVDAMVPKVVRAVRDVHAVLAKVGYQRADYELVMLSYAAPVGPDIPDRLRTLAGCPFLVEDLHWIKEVGVTVLSDGLRRAAEQANARFLDMSRSGEGHEACSGDARAEWFSRLTVRWNDLGDAQRASHAATESFHPNVAGHAQVGRCITEFLRTSERRAACRVGPDGDLHARAERPVAPNRVAPVR